MSFDDYNKARKIAERAYREDVAAGRYPYLPALDEMLRETARLRRQRVGVCEIPIRLIKGTVTKGRQESFAGNYMPLLSDTSEFALKWTSLLDYQKEEGIADPIRVYEFLGRFYVLEGNKRVSVMKYLGSPQIPAEVTRILPPDMDDEKVLAYQEFLGFYKCTGQYEPMLSGIGSYQRLADIFGQDLEKKWDWRTVQRLRTSFFRFSREYRDQGGDDLGLSEGDAFLFFLDVYGLDPLYNGLQKDLRRKVKQLWDEYRVKANRKPTAFMRLPNVRRPHTPLRRIIYKASEITAARPLKAAFIYDGDPADSRWINGHEQGRLAMQKRMRGRVRTRAFPSCSSEDQFEAAVDQAVSDGAKIIFTISPTQMNDTLRAAVRRPDVRFMNCSVHLPNRAVRTYYGRIYETKFLLGALAALLSKDHQIGYVSGAPLYGTIANINAFSIGAAMIDPDARIHLSWSCLCDRDWREEMREAGVSIVSGPDLIRPGREDLEYGLFRYEEDGSVTGLGRLMWNWDRFYEAIVRTASRITWDQEAEAARDQALNYWWGLSSGVIGIEVFDTVPPGTRYLIEGLRKSLMAGILGPFEGELRSQTGVIEPDFPEENRDSRGGLKRVLSEGGKKISTGFFEERTEEDLGLPPEEIVTMDWLHENVIGSIPGWEELTPSARQAVSAGGILTRIKK